MKNKILFKMIYCSIMAAMAYVCTFFEIPLVFTITLYGIPLIFIGIMYGPVYGIVTGLIAGTLEQLKWGLSIQTFLWLLAPIMWGGISGIVYYLLKKVFKDDKTYKKIINYSLSILVAAVLANLVNSLALVLLGYSSEPVTNVSLFFAYAIPRLVSIPIHVLIYVPVCYLICEKMKKIKMFNFE